MAIVGEMALGVASNIVFESLKRPLSSISHDIRRRDQISRALNDRPSLRHKVSDSVSIAIQDLARVIGNAEGKLTYEVRDFLKAFQNTAIPETIVRAILCNTSTKPLEQKFEEFYDLFKDLPFNSSQLFNAFVAATTARIEDVDDKNLLEIIRSQHEETSTQIDFIIESLDKALRSKHKIPPSILQDCRIKVAKSIEFENRYISIETLKGPKQFKLRSLSIPGRVVQLDESHIQAAKVPHGAPTTSYLPFRRSFEKVVILGDPGGGKSTLTQLISYDLANSIILDTAHPGRTEFDTRDLKVPLKVVLRRFEAQQSKSPSYSLFDYLRDQIRICLDNDAELATAFLTHTLGMGEAMIIFDGLDEILNVGSRRDIISLIEQFSQIYTACPTIVTSRLVGYKDAALSEQFSRYGLDRFNMDEVKTYSQKAIAAVAQLKTREASFRAQEFVSQTENVGGDLRENPLMLGLMVQIFLYRGDVPSNRPEVYKECATLMFEKWDGRRQIIADVPRYDMELLDVFGYVASKTYGNADTEEGVSKSWLIKELRSHFEDWYVDKASANRAAISLVTFLTGRAWVMTEVGPEIFKFTHRTFLEFFFARNLLSQVKGIEELIKHEIIPHVVKNEWSVISHLALHMAVFRDSGKSKQAAESIDYILDNSNLPPKQELSLLSFIISSFEYLVISEGNYVKILDKVVKKAIKLGTSESSGAMSIIAGSLQTSGNRKNLATKVVCENIKLAIAGDNISEILFSMYIIGKKDARGIPHRHRFLFNNTLDEQWILFEDLRNSFKNRMDEIAHQDASVAKAYIYVYDEARSKFYNIFGQKLIETSNNSLAPQQVDEFLSEALATVSWGIYSDKIKHRQNYIVNFTDREEFVFLVANDIINQKIEINLSWRNDRDREFFPMEDIEAAIDIIIRIGGRTKKLTYKNAELLGSVLVCSTAILNENHALSHTLKDTSRKNRRILGIPPHLLNELVLITPNPVYRDWLSKKLREPSQGMVPSKRATSIVS